MYDYSEDYESLRQCLLKQMVLDRLRPKVDLSLCRDISGARRERKQVAREHLKGAFGEPENPISASELTRRMKSIEDQERIVDEIVEEFLPE